MFKPSSYYYHLPISLLSLNIVLCVCLRERWPETKREIANFNEEEEAQAQADIWKYILGFTEMAVVKCAIELGIADFLDNRKTPTTLSDLSSALKCSPSSLYRIMRFLIHRGIFKETDQFSTIGYVQTPLSRLLMKEGPHSMANIVLLESSTAMLAPWHGLRAKLLSSDKFSFVAANGDDLWGYGAKNPAHSKMFDDGMACLARATVPAVLKGCPKVFEGVKSVVDVGGGNGTAMGIIVKACPWIRGINFDLPHVVAMAPVWDDVEHVGGDMFVEVPKVDAVYIMQVLHDWDDDESISILKCCKDAIPQESGKVIIVDAVMEREDEHKFTDAGLRLDMVMLAHTSKGKERTAKKWEYVLNEVGFSRYTIKHIQDVHSVIVAYP